MGKFVAGTCDSLYMFLSEESEYLYWCGRLRLSTHFSEEPDFNLLGQQISKSLLNISTNEACNRRNVLTCSRPHSCKVC